MSVEARMLSSLCLVLALAASACDDPAPVVLGRLQIRVRDAGGGPIDAGEQEHERDEHERARDADDHDREEPEEHP